MSGTFTSDMELDILSQKGQNRTTCNPAWSCQCIQFSSAPLNLNGPRFFFNFPSKVGEIIMYTSIQPSWNLPLRIIPPSGRHLRLASWWAVISPLLFVLAMELILQGAANTSKGVMKNKHLTLSPSRAFMDDITILVLSQIAADGLIQRYYDLFTWARMKAKSKKNWSLSLVFWTSKGSGRKTRTRVYVEQSILTKV